MTRLKTPTIEIRCKIKVYKFEETHCNTLLKKRKKDKTPTIQLGCKINVYYDDDFQQSAQTGTLSHKSLKNGLTHFNINNNNNNKNWNNWNNFTILHYSSQCELLLFLRGL